MAYTDPIVDITEALRNNPKLAEAYAKEMGDVAAFDAAVEKLNGRSFATPDRRWMPQHLLDLLSQNRGRIPDGTLYLVIIPDRNEKPARVYGTTTGLFWPALPAQGEGKGTKGRNEWAAILLSETYESLRGER